MELCRYYLLAICRSFGTSQTRSGLASRMLWTTSEIRSGFANLEMCLTVISQVRPAVESVVEDIKSGGKPADVIR